MFFLLLGKRELIALQLNCLLGDNWMLLFFLVLIVLWVGLQCLIVAFPVHAH